MERLESIVSGGKWNNGKISLTVWFWILIVLVKQVHGQCCLAFEGNACVSCPPGTHIFRGNCIFDRPNCLEYTNGFDCSICREGFTLNSTANSCIESTSNETKIEVPLFGFEELPNNEYSNSLIQQIEATMRSNFPNEPNLVALRIYTRTATPVSIFQNYSSTQERFYRIIFTSDKGLVETVLLYSPNTNTQGTNSTEHLALLSFDSFPKREDEEFIDIASVDDSSAITLQIRTTFPQLASYEVIDAFRSLNAELSAGQVRMVLIYRLFLGDPNEGLRQINVTIRGNSENQESLDINNLDATISNLLHEISQAPNFKDNFLNTTLTSVMKSVHNGIETYNVTYTHIESTVNVLHQSFFIFDIDTNLRRVIIRSFYLYKYPELSNANPDTTPIRNDTIINVTNPNTTGIEISSSSQPLLTEINQQLVFQEFIDLLSFLRTDTFDAIRRYLQRFYPARFVGGDLIKAASTENSTFSFYEVAFRIYNAAQDHQYFTFSVDKSANRLDLMRLFAIPLNSRNETIFDDNNRTNAIANLDQNIKALMPLFTNTTEFNSRALLFVISELSYRSSLTSGLNDILNQTLFSFKYYFPVELNETYEYIEYRVRVVENQPPKLLSNIIFPKEVFREVNASDGLVSETINFFLEMNLVVNGSGFTKVKTWESLQRVGIYRVQLIFANKYDCLYEIDTNMFLPFRLIRNETILPTVPNNNSSQVNNSNSTNNTAPGKTIIENSTKTPEKNNSLEVIDMLKIFPNKTAKQTNLTVTDLIKDPSLLSDTELKAILADFLKIGVETVGTVKILSRKILEGSLETYSIEFVLKQNLKTGTTQIMTPPKVFIFQISSKVAQSTSSLINSLANSMEMLFNSGINMLRSKQDSNNLLNVRSQEILRNIHNSINDVQAPSNLAQASSQALRSASFDNLFSKTPQIVPLRFVEKEETACIESLNLSSPIKASPEAIDILDKKLSFPSIYGKGIVTVVSERKLPSQPKLSLISLNHPYYGFIDVLVSISENRIVEVYYRQRGYLTSASDFTPLLQIPEIQKMQIHLAEEISKIFKQINYKENEVTKIVSFSDIVFWRLKKLLDLDDIEIFYEFEGFLVKGNILAKRPQNSSSVFNPKIVSIEAICNKFEELSEEEGKRSEIERLTLEQDFRKAEKFLWTFYGEYLGKGEIVDISKTSSEENCSNFTAKYYSNYGLVEVKLSHNNTTNITTVKEISNVYEQKELNGCKLEEQISDIKRVCQECLPGFYLHPKDRLCYFEIYSCLEQSGELCLQCNGLLIPTNSYKCV